jgi:HEAT repeat protein
MLNSLVSDSQTDPILRYKAADALGQLGEANPRIITPDMIQELMDIVTDNKTRVVLRSSAADALGRLGQANPQAVPSDVIQRLITSISDLNTDFSSQYYAGIALVPIGQANPQRVQSELVEDLMAIVKSPDAPQRFFAVRALGQLGQVSPESVSPETIQALLALMSEKLRSDYYKNVAECLEELAQANPRLVTPDVIGILHSIFNDPQVDSTQRFYAVSTLGELARINPYAATAETTQTMLAIATYRGNNFSIRQDMFNTIGKVRAANPGAMPTDLVPMLLKLLKDDRDSTMRIVGAYGIFFLVLYDPGHEKPIRAELEKLSADSLPHLRMAAARTSEMLTIGNWVQEVRADPNQGAHIKMRLEALKDSPEDHIKFAAEVALEEVAKIEKEKR